MNIKIAAATVLVALSLTACGSNSAPAPSVASGDEKTISRIKALKDCDKLQKEFDTASANADRNREAGKLELAQASTTYMQVALDRQTELKCFG